MCRCDERSGAAVDKGYPEVPETIGNRHFGIPFLLYIAYLRYVMNLPENKIVTLLFVHGKEYILCKLSKKGE